MKQGENRRAFEKIVLILSIKGGSYIWSAFRARFGENLVSVRSRYVATELTDAGMKQPVSKIIRIVVVRIPATNKEIQPRTLLKRFQVRSHRRGDIFNLNSQFGP